MVPNGACKGYSLFYAHGYDSYFNDFFFFFFLQDQFTDENT